MIIKLNYFPKIVVENVVKATGTLNYNNSFFNSTYLVSDSSILFANNSKINFWSFEANLANKKRGNLIELIFFGLNYNAKRIKFFRKPYVLDLQKSHKIKVDESRVSLLKTRVFKRRILFWSYDRNKLTELVDLLKEKRPKNSYSGHGLLSRDEKYSVKPGKVRQK